MDDRTTADGNGRCRALLQEENFPAEKIVIGNCDESREELPNPTPLQLPRDEQDQVLEKTPVHFLDFIFPDQITLNSMKSFLFEIEFLMVIGKWTQTFLEKVSKWHSGYLSTFIQNWLLLKTKRTPY